MKKRFKLYIGTKHNGDKKRPSLQSICYKVDNDYKPILKTTYVLENILVHSGKYDSYVIRNQETGKTSTVKMISVELKQTVYKEKVFFLNQSKPFDNDFYKVKSILDKNPNDITENDKITLLSIYSIAYHNDGKIENISSGDSTATNCTFCQSMRKEAEKVENHICGKCYDIRQENYKNVSVLNRHSLNLLIMSSIEYTEEELKHVHGITNLFRVNSSGDIENVIHALNMIRLIKVNPQTHAAIWSKNVPDMIAALKIEKKPENCILIQSDYLINSNTPKNQAFDYIFRVYTKGKIDAAIKSGMSECNGKKCMDCGYKCYFGNHSSYEIVEVLR